MSHCGLGAEAEAEMERITNENQFAFAVIDPELAKTAGRNDPCPCGSGKKFKQCHWDRVHRS